MDIDKIMESKRRRRAELRALPFEEKLRILEHLRRELFLGLAEHRAEYKRELDRRKSAWAQQNQDEGKTEG
jgi:hypothetical protein